MKTKVIFYIVLGFSTNQNTVYRWTITAPFRSMARRLLNNFINLSKTGIVHQDLHPSRTKRDLNDVQSVMDLLKYTFINPAEESSLISL